ncbi:MAG: hypothetical protein EPN85_13830 [Bacteroidetes bacterium]|nr:MAG: hypothetical protein EPN85_13830 [Bacteroidota bacterium]
MGLLLLLPLGSGLLLAQTQTVSGKITDGATKEPLGFANIIVKDTAIGTTADANGNFQLNVDFKGKEEITLLIFLIGYQEKKIAVKKDGATVNLSLEEIAIVGKEVVVTGSRVSEKIMESPATIQKITAKDIKETASGDFYEGMGTLKGIDITTSSLGFKAVNMRGFNSTAPIRVVQFIDGMDNQAPGLNFPVGNLVGANDLDLENIEVITGPASALYGPNAFQGVVSMKTKNPFDYPGLSVQLKGGTNNLMDGQFRYANFLDSAQKFAFKLTGSFMQADDWKAEDPLANRYGDISTTQDLSAIVAQLQYDPALTQEERDKYLALNNYLGFYPLAFPGKKTINAPGYMETDLSDHATKSAKFGASVHYKIRDSLQASYTFKHGRGTAVYQGTNRYSINNIGFQQHKLQVDGKRFSVKAYTTLEDAGDSYDIVFTGINISKATVPGYISSYLGEYFRILDSLTNGYSAGAQLWMVDSAHSSASAVAGNAWFKPGTSAYDSLKNKIVKDGRLTTGSRFIDRSSLQHLEGQYNFDCKFMEAIAGGAFRRYNPNSYGTIFKDTLINPNDTLSDGSQNPDGNYVDISTYEMGGFIQSGKKFFNDHLKLIGSIRLDKTFSLVQGVDNAAQFYGLNENYPLQFSPRLSAIISRKNNVFRISVQSAFRSPTLQNQFILLDLGPITLKGNLDGMSNLYTLESVDAFQANYESTYEVNPDLLKTIELNPIKPEQVKTVEAGYRGIINGKFYADVNMYYSVYKNFIGEVRVAQPGGDASAGEESGTDAILTNLYKLYQMPVNAKQDVQSWGGGLGLAYYFSNKYTGMINYTYSDIDTSKLTDPIIPGFNTPKHKVNVGVKGNKVYKDFGFSLNYQWVDKFRWQSTFGDGDVPVHSLVDAQLSYEFQKINSRLSAGVSNLFNKKYSQAYGAPMIGRIIYTTWTWEMKYP